MRLLNDTDIVKHFGTKGHVVSIEPDKPKELIQALLLSDEDLTHYGVKGQKWGVRTRSGNTPSVATPKSTDRKQAETLIKKPVVSLSNKQLKKLNERMQLESSYAKLSKDPNKKTGEDHIKKALAYGTMATSAYTLMNSPAAKALIKTGAKAITGGHVGVNEVLYRVGKRL